MVDNILSLNIKVEQIANTTGKNILHKELVENVMAELKNLKADSVKVFVGGTIPKSDHAFLSQLGVAAVFTADMSLEEVVQELAIQLS